MGCSRRLSWGARLSQMHLIQHRGMPFALVQRRDKRPELFSVLSLSLWMSPCQLRSPFLCTMGLWVWWGVGRGAGHDSPGAGWLLGLCRR